MPPRSADADLAYCRALIRHGSRSFHAASLLLPARARDPALAVYAFCRLADDAVDLGAAPQDAVAELSERWHAICRGCPQDRAVDRALARVQADHAVPAALMDALIEGLAWDAARRRYETLADLTAYAARVAGAVGAIMACLMGARSAAQLARATDLGVAMQFTNIARDVGEDARAGRLYLPLDWFAKAGIDPDAWLTRPRPDPAIAAMTERLLAEADGLYARASAGIAGLPASCRPAIFAARYLYAAIGHRVAKAGHNAILARSVVPDVAKVPLVARALAAAVWHPARSAAPPLPQTRFLVDAAALPDPIRRGFAQQIVWTVELFTEIERRERLGRGAAAP